MRRTVLRLFFSLVPGVLGSFLGAGPMLTEANSPVVKEVALETEFVVCGGGKAHVFALDALQ